MTPLIVGFNELEGGSFFQFYSPIPRMHNPVNADDAYRYKKKLQALSKL